MPPPGPSIQALTALLRAGSPLPDAALGTLAAVALRDPADQRPLRVALLHCPDLHEDLAARLAMGPGRRAPVDVTVAYLLRPEHDRTTLAAHLAAEVRIGVPQQLATHDAATDTLLGVLAGGRDLTVLGAVLAHPHSSPATRCAALRRVQERAAVHDLAGVHSRHLDYFASLIAGLPAGFADEAAAVLTEPGLLAAVTHVGPLAPATYRRIIEACLDHDPRGDGHDELETLACQGLRQHADPATRRHAAAVLHAHGRGSVDGHAVEELLGVHVTESADVLGQRWATARDLATRHPDVATALAGGVARLGDDPAAWEALLALGDTFTGTVAELLATIAATVVPAAG